MGRGLESQVPLSAGSPLWRQVPAAAGESLRLWPHGQELECEVSLVWVSGKGPGMGCSQDSFMSLGVRLPCPVRKDMSAAHRFSAEATSAPAVSPFGVGHRPTSANAAASALCPLELAGGRSRPSQPLLWAPRMAPGSGTNSCVSGAQGHPWAARPPHRNGSHEGEYRDQDTPALPAPNWWAVCQAL